MPPPWKAYALDYRLRTALYQTEVRLGETPEPATVVTLDGEVLGDESLPRGEDGTTHQGQVRAPA